MHLTQELHRIRAHLLHYSSLLEDFKQSVVFVLNTPNPAMEFPSHDDVQQKTSHDLLQKECNNLLMQIERLQMSRGQQDKRLKNVMDLAFSSVNIEDSKRMQKLTEAALKDSAAMKLLTEAAVRDSAAMKQIAYLTMIFLPSSFVAGVFGMNIQEINPGTLGSLEHYFEVAIPLTAVTIWIIVAFQGKWTSNEGSSGRNMLTRLLWPYMAVRRLFGRGCRDKQGEEVELKNRNGQAV